MKKNKTIDPAVKEYLKEVSANLACGRTRKRFILNGLESLLTDFIQENPNSTIEDIRAEFGDPEKIQSNLETKNEYIELTRKAKKKTLILIAVIIILLIVAVSAIWIIVHLKSFYGGTFTVSDAY